MFYQLRPCDNNEWDLWDERLANLWVRYEPEHMAVLRGCSYYECSCTSLAGHIELDPHYEEARQEGRNERSGWICIWPRQHELIEREQSPIPTAVALYP
jgi:hypothetical protein